MQGLTEEGFSGFHAMPWRGAGGVGQGNEVKVVAGEGGADFLADEGVELLRGHELGDGELADGNDKPWFKELDFTLQPGGAVLNFIGGRHAVAAGGFFAGETATNGGHIDGGAENFFGHARSLMEPTEESFAGRPGEWPAEDGLLVAGSLAHEQDLADDGTPADDRRAHLRAKSAGAEAFDVSIEEALGLAMVALVCGHGINKTVFHRLRKKIKLGAWTKKPPNAWKSWNRISRTWSINTTN